MTRPEKITIGSTKNSILALMRPRLYVFVLIFSESSLTKAASLSSLAESFKIVPLGKAVLSGLTLEKMVELTAQTFVVGIKIIAPTMGVLLCITFGMGILARTVPQMNVFIVGFPLKICIGILTLMLTFPLFAYVFGKLLGSIEEDILYLMYSM